MLKEGSIVKVRLYDTHGKEIIYSKYDENFEVARVGGRLGLHWNTTRQSSSTETFLPFSAFAPSVVFEETETGKRYHYSTLTDWLEELDVVSE